MVAISMIKALTIYQKVGFQKVMVEFSHSQLKALFMSKEECLMELDDSITRIRNFLSVFCFLDFHVILGSCNKVAMISATYAKETTSHLFSWKRVRRFTFKLLLPSYLNNISIIYLQKKKKKNCTIITRSIN